MQAQPVLERPDDLAAIVDARRIRKCGIWTVDLGND
jgi:hypothetical protein